MNRPLHSIPSVRAWFVAIAGLTLITGAPLLLRSQSPSSKTSFKKYKMVQSRNIFDPDRRAMRISQGGGSGSGGGESKPVTPSDYIALTGVMVTENKSLAFFSGSRSEYSKVLPLQETIAGARITKITASNIEIQRDGKLIAVAVGQTVPFDNNSAPVAAPVPAGSAPAAPGLDPQSVGAGVPIPSPNPTSPASPSNVSDVMRRMMERRQQELK